ncbi:MAG: MmgE/PrpD family protein [Thermoleophilia bacterium]|nr:MmgE/PrpD family protein [Thermoleophilia bacterium]
MTTEQEIARFVCHTTYGDIPAAALGTVRDVVLGVLGTTIAGARAEGCETVVAMARELGGRPEASILVHGDRVPAQQAAFANAVMARALDFEDSMAPGAHAGAAVVSAALAAAELAGGASGADFLAAVAVGLELAVRLNLGEAEYDGFDPTGVCVPFGSTAAAAKILGLSEDETLNALALAFCRCGGSFQANVDGALAVRMIQGWVVETGVTCARLAARGITGPRNFLDGVYGYFHLFGRDRVGAGTVLPGLGSQWHVDTLVFKKYPSCGGTQSSTELILDLIREENLEADDVERIEIRIVPYLHRLVGHPFELGSNPKVNAQFSVRWCVANALVRKASTLAHFEIDAVGDPDVLRLVERIEVVSDAALDARSHSAADLCVVTKDGGEHLKKMDVAPGFPGNPLSKAEHVQRFWDCLAFGGDPGFDVKRGEQIIHMVDHLEERGDVRDLIALLLPA